MWFWLGRGAALIGQADEFRLPNPDVCLPTPSCSTVLSCSQRIPCKDGHALHFHQAEETKECWLMVHLGTDPLKATEAIKMSSTMFHVSWMSQHIFHAVWSLWTALVDWAGGWAFKVSHYLVMWHGQLFYHSTDIYSHPACNANSRAGMALSLSLFSQAGFNMVLIR